VCRRYIVFFLSDTASAETYTLSLHDALPICGSGCALRKVSFQILLIESRVNIPVNKAKKAATQIPASRLALTRTNLAQKPDSGRSEEHTSELQSRENLVCRLLLEKKKR